MTDFYTIVLYCYYQYHLFQEYLLFEHPVGVVVVEGKVVVVVMVEEVEKVVVVADPRRRSFLST
tara:strand:- start:164 stop:355 length:192 start_codon:yes stop_codon:yes gene_type:complete